MNPRISRLLEQTFFLCVGKSDVDTKVPREGTKCPGRHFVYVGVGQIKPHCVPLLVVGQRDRKQSRNPFLT